MSKNFYNVTGTTLVYIHKRVKANSEEEAIELEKKHLGKIDEDGINLSLTGEGEYFEVDDCEPIHWSKPVCLGEVEKYLEGQIDYDTQTDDE